MGGERKGNIIFPTILENVTDQTELVKDETFGPVVPLLKFDSVDEVISRVNASPFGLQAGAFTNDLLLVKKLFKEYREE